MNASNFLVKLTELEASLDKVYWAANAKGYDRVLEHMDEGEYRQSRRYIPRQDKELSQQLKGLIAKQDEIYSQLASTGFETVCEFLLDRDLAGAIAELTSIQADLDLFGE